MLVVATAGAGPLPVGGVGAGTKVVVEGKIVEALPEAGADGAGEVLTGARSGWAGDAFDGVSAGGAGDASEVAVGGGPEGEVDVKTRGFLPKSDSSRRLMI